MATPVQRIDTCLARLGREDFVLAFLDLARLTGAGQVMVFSYDGDAASCLVSRNFAHSALGEELAGLYLDGWFRQDPLWPEILALPPGAVRLRQIGRRAGAMSADYRRIFFDAPGLAGKRAVLACGERCRLIVNLYRPAAGGGPGEPGLEPLLGRLACLHFDRVTGFAFPPPLAALSSREREVCLGILAGKKTEAIAGEMGVAPSSVVTFRRRAYAKLGISSRGALFQLCR
ncbi:helix-turn-helix transcriptional regulator [Actibacterium sp. MT2.3-13A]|uniref:helix-turn-helix transcriptional regulator n=1 Tax=Actibacterium sp. MT2.3-13A TaxID=2828332 RepID=UPI001BA6045E|nr:helix-turn-helix transcriptional regulator [Actibacterium sp. MT2.3-13A]